MIPESLTSSTPETQGYRLSHTMLRVSNPERSLRFYRELMGMSLIFTLNTGPFTVYYLGYPGPDDHSAVDIANTMSSRTGLLELVHVPETNIDDASKGDEKLDEPAVKGFGHLGFYVPDVEGALKRAEESGYTVVKSLDNISITTMDLPESLSGVPFHSAFLQAFSQIGFIRDPDG